MKKKMICLLSTLTLSFSLSAQVIKLNAEDGYQLEARYTASLSDSKKAVLMLHQCNMDKDMYLGLAKSLAQRGVHSLALDLRGYGGSKSEAFAAKGAALDLSTREKNMAYYRQLMETVWPLDVAAGYKSLVDKVGSDNIAFIGASCGGEQAVTLAKQYQPKSFVFFSAYMDEPVMNEFVELSHIPALFIAAQQDKVTFESSNKSFQKAKNQQTRLISYKGDGHGSPLFELDHNLETVMLDWFDRGFK
jgi:esterase/lipase